MGSQASTFILIALMVVAFYFLIMRPQRKRQQAQQQAINALQPGARVVTGSGLYGTIVEVGTKQAVLEISPGAHLTVLKQAIVRVVPAGEEDEDLVGLEDGDDEPELVEPTYPDTAFADPSKPGADDVAGTPGTSTGTTTGEQYDRPQDQRPRDAS